MGWALLLLAGLLGFAWFGSFLLGGGLAASIKGRGGGHLSPAPLPLLALGGVVACSLLALLLLRLRRRRGEERVRLEILPYRHEEASPETLLRTFEGLHWLLRERSGWHLLAGPSSLALELHYTPREGARFAVCCPAALRPAVEALLRIAYPGARFAPLPYRPGPGQLLVLRRLSPLPLRALALPRERFSRPPIEDALEQLGTAAAPALVQLALAPAPRLLEGLLFLPHRTLLDLRRPALPGPFDRYRAERSLELVGRGLFWFALRVWTQQADLANGLGAALLAKRAEGGLSARRSRHYSQAALARGQAPLLPRPRRALIATSELVALWQLPSPSFTALPVATFALPRSAAPAGVWRPRASSGLLRDELGAVGIDPRLRRQNLALPGAVGQGKTTVLVASFAEDLQRERCAVLLFDPKGDAAEAALSQVPPERPCTVLDLARPTCGFNPLAAKAAADVVADHVVGALRSLFSEEEIRASSDRYLRNAVIAVLAAEEKPTLWDAARLLSVGTEGRSYRELVGSRIRELPAFKEIAEFFSSELAVQLTEARATTTAKLDAPQNKLARLLNSPSIKRVLLNESLVLDLDRIIANGEVLVVKGALGAMGPGNTAVLLQLLMGMVDAALARQQDLRQAERRMTVALKVDEAPLVINRGFAQTIALKRSAGLETVAAWQSDRQWEPELQRILDAIFGHRIYFATASVEEAERSAVLLGGERWGSGRSAHPLADPRMRLHLPPHYGIASFISPGGRLAPFLGKTVPSLVSADRVASLYRLQERRGGRFLESLSQPDWRPAKRRGQPPCSAQPLARPPRPAPPTGPFREVLALGAAVRVRPLPAPSVYVALEPTDGDLALLRLLGRLVVLLASQIHRHFGEGHSLSTTQRRLKRLVEAGLVERLALQRRDGSTFPHCYLLAPRGAALVEATFGEQPKPLGRPPALAQLVQRLRASGWLLACAKRQRLPLTAIFGAAQAAHEPKVGKPPRLLTPALLQLPRGRVPHGLFPEEAAAAEERSFETVRPDGGLQSVAGVDLLLELDDRLEGGVLPKIERYNRFLAGWSYALPRYRSGRRLPAVVFLCRDRRRALALAALADPLLGGAHAYPGEPPSSWPYPARERTFFCLEGEVYAGRGWSFLLPALPPSLRKEGLVLRTVALPGFEENVS